MALRSTCKFISTLVAQQYDRICFTGISVLLTRRSLQTMIDISSHPRIGPQIQVITLTPLRTFPEALQSLIPAHRPVYHEGDLAKAKASGKTFHQYLDRYHEEMELEQSGDAARLLSEAFRSLKKYDRSLFLRMSDVEVTHIGAQGCFSGALVEEKEEDEEDGDDEEMSVFKSYWKQTMGLLIKAVADSGCQVSRLFLENVKGTGVTGEGKLWDDNIDESINRLSAGLTAFDVDVRFHDRDAAMESVKQVLSQAKNLKILTFQRLGKHFQYDLFEISDSITSRSLEAINISYLCCSVSDLISFLSKHKSTLVYFCLDYTRLLGSWRSLVRWIRSNLTSLHTFGMSDVYDDDFQLLHYEETVPNCDFDRVEDMPAALEKLLAKKKHHETKETDDTPSTD
jgi:hypothetical protein